MNTIWLNLAVALLWWYFGWSNALWLAPLSIGVLAYSFVHDWHVDAATYRDALADADREDESH
jgi:hypothetical protein